MHHSKQKYAHFCAGLYIMGYGICALWDLWDWTIRLATDLWVGNIDEDLCRRRTDATINRWDCEDVEDTWATLSLIIVLGWIAGLHEVLESRGSSLPYFVEMIDARVATTCKVAVVVVVVVVDVAVPIPAKDTQHDTRRMYSLLGTTSSNGSLFRITGPLCGEFTGPRWIPLKKSSGAELWWYNWSAPWINGWVNKREAGDSRRHHDHYDVSVMIPAPCHVIKSLQCINSYSPGQNGRHFADDIFRCIFANEKFRILIKISLKFFFF